MRTKFYSGAEANALKEARNNEIYGHGTYPLPATITENLMTPEKCPKCGTAIGLDGLCPFACDHYPNFPPTATPKNDLPELLLPMPVRGFQIKEIDSQNFLRQGDIVVEATMDYMEKYHPQVGGWYVVVDGDYVTYAPNPIEFSNDQQVQKSAE